MSWNCPIHYSSRGGGGGSLLGIWKPVGKRRLEQPRRRIILLKLILIKWNYTMLNGFILISRETSGGFLWTPYTFGLHKSHEFRE